MAITKIFLTRVRKYFTRRISCQEDFLTTTLHKTFPCEIVVRKLSKTGNCFKYLYEKNSHLSEGKLKEFTGWDIREKF